MKAAFLVFILITTTLSACTSVQVTKISNTHWPQTTLPAISKSEARERFLAALTSAGATLVDETSNSIKVFSPLSGSDSTMVNFLVGSAYSEPPRDYATFIFTDRNDGTLVSTQFWREVQQYNGTWKRIELQSNAKHYNTFQQMLWDVRKKVEDEGGLNQ